MRNWRGTGATLPLQGKCKSIKSKKQVNVKANLWNLAPKEPTWQPWWELSPNAVITLTRQSSQSENSHFRWEKRFIPLLRDDHGAGVPEWTPAGVCILGWSRSRSQYFKFEPEQEPASRLRSVQEPIEIFNRPKFWNDACCCQIECN